MKRKQLYIFITGLLLSMNVFSQGNLKYEESLAAKSYNLNKYEENLSAYKSHLKNKLGIECTIPPKLKDLNKYRVGWKVRQDWAKHTGTLYGPIFLSKDKECMIAFPGQFPDFFSKEERERRGQSRINTARVQITAEIKTALGLYYMIGSPLNNDTAEFDFNDYVTIITGKKPREMFNADEIFIYDLPKGDSVFFFDESLEKMRKEKYPYCTGVYINKNGTSTLDFKFFFTEKGLKKKKKYIAMLNKNIWYDEKFHND